VFGVVLVWRGVWYIADMFLLPANELLSAVASIAIGVLALIFIDFEKRDISELG
jgi:hypothetical protein